ncbi:MAG: YbaK/EbsC family protein [Anaerolineales bacterium]|nr:YbaK/EbsC family protein [Anaerolineales bacterium]
MQLSIIETPVTRDLQSRGIPFRVFTHPGPVHSLEQAAQERNQRPEQIVRSIVFRLAAGEFIMVLVAGPAQISWPALRQYLGVSRVTMASQEEVLACTGYQTGAVSPFGLPAPMRILIDEKVFQPDEISIGSGVRNTTIILRSQDLRRALPEAEVGCFVECN